MYLSETFPTIPVTGVCTFSVCAGSYISIELGKTGFGSVNNFKFPFPETLTSKSKDSPAFNFVFEGTTLKSKTPTAPVKLAGFSFSGSGFTLIVCIPVESAFSTVVISIRPNQSLLPVGTSASTSILNGSILFAPASSGYKITFRRATTL